MARVYLYVVTAIAVLCCGVGGNAQTKATYANDDLRTGWYPNQSILAPPTVGSSLFGKIFDIPIVGQVYAQPLVSGSTLLVATEANWIYGLDVLGGSIKWSRNVGTPWNSADYGCSDLTPQLGITATPVVDNTSGTAYFIAKTYLNGSSGPAGFFMHAVDILTGAERPNFPVQITGAANNDANSQFDGTMQNSRPGLLLMGNVVYAAFGSMCDYHPFKGWVAGVSTSGQQTALWTTAPGPNDGGGIWQAGGGLVSDGPGRIFLATGNGYSSTPNGNHASGAVPAGLAESTVRLAVQADGTLQADNFFSPYDSPSLDNWDADLGSGAPIGLPGPYFGTTAYPNLLFLCGKQGYVYLLNRDNLGGQRMGPGGADAVVSRIGPYGGVWSRPAVWPGDGGHIFVVSASSSSNPSPSAGQLRSFRYGLDGNGNPAISLESSSNEQFGSLSSSPVVTSDGTTSGSALVWLVQLPDASGNNAQLMAYDANPINGQMNLRFSSPVGQASKFTPPGVGPGRIYVGTRDGHLLGFGVPANVALSAPLTQFGSVVAGLSSQATVTLTASTAVTIQSITTTNPVFQVGQVTLPATMAQGDTLAVPVQFAPDAGSLQSGNLHVVTNLGALDFSLVGNGVNPQAHLEAFPSILSLGGTSVGGSLAGSVTISNDGGQPLSIQSLVGPSAPFSLSGAPPPNTVLVPGQAITLTVQFAPATTGNFTDSLKVVSTAGTMTINLSAASNLPGALTVVGQSLNYGRIGVNSQSTLTFTVANTGASGLTITRSKPPALGQFTATNALPEGTVLGAGEVRQIGVQFAPNSAGNFSDTWSLNSDTSSGLTTVTMNGVGVVGTGVLSASVNTVPGTVALTTEGTTDWVHWGDSARKANVSPQIAFNTVGAQGFVYFSTDGRTQSWTDGAPTLQASNESSGIFMSGVGQGFSVNVPADLSKRTLTLHVGGWNSGGQLQATLSDGSVVPYSDTTPTVPGSYYRDYTLTYQAASPNQTLTVTWTQTDGPGNVTLTSAALSGVAATPAASPIAGSVNTIPGTIALTSEGPTDWMHFGDSARKAQVSPQITLSPIGNQGVATYNDDQRTQGWTDGSPIGQASGERTGIFVSGTGNGFSLSFPADQTQRTVTVHVGGWSSAGQLQATISDGSMAPYVDVSAGSPGSYYRDYTLIYKAASANQTLRVNWTMTGGGGNVTLSSAALSGGASVPPPATNPGIPGTVNTNPGSIALTTEGSTDWMHFGDTARKAQVTPQITSSTIGNQGVAMYGDDQRTQGWTDGTPMLQANGEHSGIFTSGAGNGFALLFPADQTQRTVTIHVGGWNSAGQLQATLSDGSMAPYVDSTLPVSNSYYRDYTLTYQAGSANQTLRVTWTMTGGGGNVTLSSAALSGGAAVAAPPPATNPGVPTGWVYLVSQNSGKCADVEGISTAPGARIHQWTCLNGENQKFQFTPVSGGYEISIKNSGLQLTVDGGPTALQDGAYFVQDPFTGANNQVFNLQAMSDGSYEIVALHSGKCMDVEGVSQQDGAYIHQWSCLSAPNQKWTLVPAQ